MGSEESKLVAAIKGHNAAVDLHPNPYCRECHWQSLKALEVIATLQARNAELERACEVWSNKVSVYTNDIGALEKRNAELEERGSVKVASELLVEIRLLEAKLKTSEEALAAVTKESELLKEELLDYVQHSNRCVLSHWEAGEPTADGGYRQKFGDKWYQARPIDETPKCNCGLDDIVKERP